jgi:16S rRNA (adenine1518-N6/adenine1519-N6)-dimethyltransferase
MVQKEVADRDCASPGSKTYGILSVLLQAFYHIEYLFTVSEQVFIPPPKVKSAVVRLSRNDRELPEDEAALLQMIVKAAFNQRRKILGNALKSAGIQAPAELAGLRAEQLSVDQFLSIVSFVKSAKTQDV